MRCWTFRKGEILDGIEFTGQGEKRFVLLGKKDRLGGRHTKVHLMSYNPPLTRNNRVIEAQIHKGCSQSGYLSYQLWYPNRDDGSVLIRISTEWEAYPGTSGTWRTEEGFVEEWARGHGANGRGHRQSVFLDSLVVAEPGALIYVRPEGGRKTEPWAIEVTDEGVFACSWEELYERDEAAE